MNKRVCPVCSSQNYKDFEKYSAYKICTKCNLHYQLEPPEKVYEGKEENFGLGPSTGHLISDNDKRANEYLADLLYNEVVPTSILDIGTKYPYLLSVLKDKTIVLGIDAIEDVIKYGEELDVPVLCADFEELNISPHKGQYDLITLVHVIEHFYNLVPVIKKILQCLSENGTLFVRTPTPDVSGIERDLTEHHLSIHPNLFTEKSIKHLFNTLGYEVYKMNKMEGSGQTDFYIRKNRKATLSICMIVRNEEENIRDCLESIKDIADEIIVVDTGSADKTKEVVSEYTNKIFDFKWVDDFSKARNYSLEQATKDYILWVDADDIVLNPKEIIKLLENKPEACYFNILYGNERFKHCRLFKNNQGVHFKGMIHEYPAIGNLKLQNTNINIEHKTQKQVGENRLERNYRILEKELFDDPNNSRTCFYLSNNLKEQGKYKEALKMYEEYLKIGTWQDERFMAQKYMGQMYMWQKKYKEAIGYFLKAIDEDDKWREAYYYIGECYFFLKEFDKCIKWMKMAIDTPAHNSPLFKEEAIYNEAPHRYIFASYETIGDNKSAYKYVKLASRINPEDKWLQKRAKYFEYKIKSAGRKIIECYRQGALGDCLMTTAALRGLKEKYPNCYIRYVTHPSSFPILEGNRYIDELTTKGRDDADEKIYFAYPEDEGYPHKPLNRHLVKIFNECAGVPDNSMELECTLTEKEVDFGCELFRDTGGYITLHVQAGWSEYKEWYDNRWEKVVEEVNKMGLAVVQLGSKDDRPIKGTKDLRGNTIKEAVSVINCADLHLGVDSFTNHASFAVNTQAVILFGSTSPVGSGYVTNTNLYKQLDCQPCYKEYSHLSKDSKGPCEYNKKCIDSITVEEVINRIKSLLDSS